MSYQCTQDLILDLKNKCQLIEIKDEVDPNLEAAEIQRRIYSQKGPAVLFSNLKGCKFPAVSNLFGTEERYRYIFRKTFLQTQLAVKLKADPPALLKQLVRSSPFEALKLPLTALYSLPKRVHSSHAPVMEQEIHISDLPRIVSWPMDGGPFITLPQVLSSSPLEPTNIFKSNIGMYRVQMTGNDYETNKEVGLHYQIHRGIGIHHQTAIAKGQDLKVVIAVGGPPAHTIAAVMPLPEGLSETVFAGMLAGRRFRYVREDGWLIPADADFCILGTVSGDEQKREGPFGDHLGYYSLEHPFPLLKVKKVYARKNAIWPFTIVGRPPQEDTSFGQIIHELSSSMVPKELPGVRALHAVDAAGVHPLLFAIGSERYTPYQKLHRPQELLTQANSILGFNQCSLAKYLWITAEQENLEIEDSASFLQHCLKRLKFDRDLHFQTKTTMDTLDYSGEGLNQGSKLILAAAGEPVRSLAQEIPKFPKNHTFTQFALVMPGVLAVKTTNFVNHKDARKNVSDLCDFLTECLEIKILDQYPLIVLTENPEFLKKSLNNFLWVTFTRSNPSHDIYGLNENHTHKHWGCEAPMIIDARLKPHHAPPLLEDEKVTARVDLLMQL